MQPGALLAPCGVSGAQNLKTAHIQSAVVHLFGVCAPFFGLELGGGEQAFFLQSVEVDKIGVARKGRAALIGAVTVAGGTERQDLPDLLARLCQKIHKLECFLAKAANTVRAGQAGHRHQDSTFTHAITFLIFNILWECRCFLS